jgi:hypothetical protein
LRTVRNKTHKPIQIHLPGGKTLHLGPLKTGQISDQAVEQDAVRKLVRAGEIEILGETETSHEDSNGAAPVHEATHGHPPTTVVLPKGNR